MEQKRGTGYKGAGVIFWRKAAGGVEVLLGLRSPMLSHAPGVWSFFGGGRNPGESPLQNALREAREETAHELDWKTLPEEHFLVRAKPDDRVWLPFTYDYSCYFCETKSSPHRWPSLNWEHTKWAWFAAESLPQPLHSEAQRVVAKLARKFG